MAAAPQRCSASGCSSDGHALFLQARTHGAVKPDSSPLLSLMSKKPTYESVCVCHTHHRKKNTWVILAGPFKTMEEAIQLRKSGALVHGDNTSGTWLSEKGGNSNRVMSKCGHPTHVNCPVRVCVSQARFDETGVHILVTEGIDHTPPEMRQPAWPLKDAPPPVLGATHPIRKFSLSHKAFALRVWREMPSATPKEVFRIFQQHAAEEGAKLRTGRNAGFEGAVRT